MERFGSARSASARARRGTLRAGLARGLAPEAVAPATWQAFVAGLLVFCLILGAGFLGWHQAVRAKSAPSGGPPTPGGGSPPPEGNPPARSGLLTGAPGGAVTRGEGNAARWRRAAEAVVTARGGGRQARVHRVAEGETLFAIARRYGVTVAALQSHNGLASDLIRPGQLLLLPGGEGPTGLEGTYIWPVLAPVSSHFGPRWGRHHNGIDLAANHGDEIRASRDGVVWLAGEVEGYGLTVVIGHDDGSRTLYAHASELLVEAGERVAQGQAIARVGSTGYSTGPHLHFEVIVDDRPVNPLDYLPPR
ncbi:M23 family metallopeptidase [Symbiobacterium terraclitae]|nr:LysM peptidoglycan-binding domain-containing M23 family metallopeptidase [Symbiobacterium terraclitae]